MGINMAFYKYIFCILLLLISVTSQRWGGEDYMVREHSLVKPYQGIGTAIPFWDFMGSTFITNNYIRLTSEMKSLQGAIWNKIPCKSRNWLMQVNFKVHGKGKDLFGDGFAIWYVKEPMVPGSVFGSKDYFTGLSIVADTYSNHNGPHNHPHPYISAMVNNGTLHYDHDRDGTHTQLAGCVAKFRNQEKDSFLSIKYENDVLTVSIDIDNEGLHDCFSAKGVILPTGYYFGVSAATGDLFDNHDIISLKFYDITSIDAVFDDDRSDVSPHASYFESPRDHVDDPAPSSMGAWQKILLLVIGVVAICSCVVIGGLLYNKQQQQRNKRFY